MRALDAALNAVWAMEAGALETLLAIAAREHEVTPEALEAYRAKTLANAEAAQVRDGVAIFTANGAMFKRANLFTAMSGATSYETLARDLTAARNDPKVKAAILNLDTPGGEASGAGELAGMIRAFAGEKPIIAYVNGMGASAGYWLAAACTEIVIDAQAILGSIGVQMAMTTRADAAGVTKHTFISSQSPLKNADPATEAGATQIQSVVDAMAGVFVGAVAEYRGVDVQTVLSDFGKGGILVGQDAVKAGLADRIGNFESVMAELSSTKRKSTGKAKGATMSDEATTITAEQRDSAVATARSEAVAAERTRVASLRKIAAGFAASDADLTAAIDGDVTVEAFSLAQADKAATARAEAAAKPQADRDAAVAALKTDEEAAAEAAASTGKEPVAKDEDTIDAVAARIAAA